MPAISWNNHSPSGFLRRPRCTTFAFRMLLIFLGFAVASPLAFCQSQASSQPPPSQPPPQQAPPQPPQKDDATAAAAKKTDKDKPKPKKVFTEEDLSSLHGGVSVVGDSAGRSSAGTGSGAGKAGSNVAPMSGRDEQYWRGQAKGILDEMAAIDQEIEKTKEDIKKYGADGFDANSGYKAGVVYIDNRASKVEQLEKRKADLEKKLDQLQEDGRKAGADPAWFR